MPLKHFDGFEHYGEKTDTAAALQTVLQSAGYVIRNMTDTTFKLVDGRLPGSLALRFTFGASSTTNPSFSRTVSTAATEVVFGFSIKTSGGRARMCRIENIIDLGWDGTNGKLKAGTQGSEVYSKDVFILDAYYFIEVLLKKSTNTVEVWANDTLQMTVPVNMNSYSDFTITWGQTEGTGAALTQEIDDHYIRDNIGLEAGAATRLGPVQVTTRFPTADVDTQWSVQGPNPNVAHYTIAARKATASSTTYLQSNVEGARDTFRSNAVLPDDNQVFGVALVSMARKGDLDDRKIGHLLKVDTVESENQVSLTANFAFQQSIFEKAPGNVEWNRNRVESTEFGIIAR